MDSAVIVVEGRGAVALFTPTTDGWARSQLKAAGFWPAWHPRNSSAAISVVKAGSEPSSTIEHIDLEGRYLGTLHQTAVGVPPVIAPRVPHYAMWSPRGDVLSYVAAGREGLSLFLTDTSGGLISDAVVTAAPIFSAWSPDGRHLAVHAGNQVVIVDVDGDRRPRVIADQAVGFRAPAYSHDGTALVYGVADGGSVKVMRSEPDGANPAEVTRFPGGIALAFRPGTNELTVAVTLSPDTGVFDDLWSLGDVTAAAPVDARRIARGPFVAFLWAPTADRLALVIPAQTGDGRYMIRAVTSAGAALAATEAFFPSQDYRTALAFFDQYAKSHHFWSPDGERLIICGRVGGDLVSASFGDPEGPYVFVWRAAAGQALERVTPGELGLFGPPPVGGGGTYRFSKPDSE
jgi:hypothetical protein